MKPAGPVAAVFALLALAFPTEAPGEPKTPSCEVFRSRREALLRRTGQDPVLVFGAAATGAYAQFRQNNRFYYLTGVTEPDAALLIIPREKKEILFLDPGDPMMERWDGPRLKAGEEASRITGIKITRPRAELPDHLDMLFAGREGLSLHMPLWPEESGVKIFDSLYPALEKQRDDPLDGGLWREERIKQKLLERFQDLTIKDTSPLIRSMREVKGPEEIEAMKEASRLSAEGFKAAFKAARPGAYEFELEAAMFGRCKALGGQGFAYNPICGAGPNANIMHYSRNDRRMEEGEIILMDAGFSWNYYAADITRCFPVSGKFSEGHRKVYEDLLGVQIAAIGRVKPGVSLIDLHNWVNNQLTLKGYGDKLMHFLSHHVGMAVHDPGAFDKPLRPGNVVSIEPGVYFTEEGFGLRIEDMVLVTADGFEILTASTPKTVEEIEALMKR